MSEVTCSIQGKPEEITQMAEDFKYRIRTNPPERLSLAEAAIYLGLSKRTVSDYVKLRRIKAVKVGRDYIFSLKNLRTFIDA